MGSRREDLDAESIANLDDDELPEKEIAGDALGSHSEDLDAEGIPDLDDELPEKEITGDPQEGMIPPRHYMQAAEDQYARDTLDQRLAEEEPDRLTVPEDSPRLMDPEAGDLEDRNEIEAETGDEGGAQSAEESAIHEIKRPTEHGLV